MTATTKTEERQGPGGAAGGSRGQQGKSPVSGPDTEGSDAGLRIGDAAARFGVSARTLRYYEELGMLSPSGYTSGGERRYHQADLEQVERILKLRDVLGLNLDEIKTFLVIEDRIEDLRGVYHERKSQQTAKSRMEQREILQEFLRLHESRIDQIDAKLARMNEFRAELVGRADRCRALLAELGPD
jgi:MerR family transcriptional regulator, repressor of the yfmOP operon